MMIIEVENRDFEALLVRCAVLAGGEDIIWCAKLYRLPRSEISLLHQAPHAV